MSTVTQAQPAAGKQGNRVPSDLEPERRFVIHDADWKLYDAIVTALGDRRVFVAYDGKDLEFMSPSTPHEWFKEMLGRLIELLTLELNIAIWSGGSTTFRHEAADRGMEPDKCYWIANQSQIRGKREIDLAVDPPPDLAIEIEISRSWVNRQDIYRKLKIPEVWRYNGESLRVFLLQEGDYVESDGSACFPFLPVRELEPFLDIDVDDDDTTRARRFLDWVREQEFAVGKG